MKYPALSQMHLIAHTQFGAERWVGWVYGVFLGDAQNESISCLLLPSQGCSHPTELWVYQDSVAALSPAVGSILVQLS